MNPAAAETFPRLVPDSAECCPYPMAEIQEYVKLEDGDGDEGDRDLRFVRTAKAFDSDWWIWEYQLEDGSHCYVTVEKAGNQVAVAMDWATERFSPEEYIVDLRRRTGKI